MGAAFLCGHTGIENRTIDNSAAYIQTWLGKLKGDKRLVVHAGANAQKAADFILGRTFDDEVLSRDTAESLAETAAVA